MKLRLGAAGLLLQASLFAQYGQHRFSWQDACFNNPALPYCQGHDSAVKPQPHAKNGAPAITGVYEDPMIDNVTPAQVAAGAIDWRFADPAADALVGFHARKLSSLPAARSVIAQLGANQGLGAADVAKVLERLSGVDQVAISVREDQTVVMFTGRGSDSTLPALEPGWEAVPVVGNAVLVGRAEAVKNAVERMTMDVAPNEMMRFATRRQALSEFWAVATPGSAGPPAGSPKVKRSLLTVSVDDLLTSDLVLEFSTPPDAKTLAGWVPALQGSIDGNVVHVSAIMEADQVQQKFAQAGVTPIGEQLAALVKAARYLPARDSGASKQRKAVIFGLDSGPRELNQ